MFLEVTTLKGFISELNSFHDIRLTKFYEKRITEDIKETILSIILTAKGKENTIIFYSENVVSYIEDDLDKKIRKEQREKEKIPLEIKTNKDYYDFILTNREKEIAKDILESCFVVKRGIWREK